MTPYYSDELVTIYHGDCREILPEGPAVIVMDPPYGISWKRSANPRRGSKASEGIANDGDTTLRDHILSHYADVPAATFGSFYAPFPSGIRQVLIWEKPPDAGVVGSTTGFRRDAEPIFLTGPWPVRSVLWSSVLRSGARSIGNPSSAAGRTGHPHAKPVDLIEALLAPAPVGLILDPFMGTGSTLVAAKRYGRPAIGIELEERWCQVAAERLAQGVLLTNKESAA